MHPLVDSTFSIDASQPTACVDLASYDRGTYSPGRGILVRGLWYCVSLTVFESGWFPFNGIKRWVLRRFGAKIGRGVVIKPHVRIKFPWKLAVGNHCWVGQSVWIDNLAQVSIADNVCISQGVYLCTGSHDYRERTFDLITCPIVVNCGAWVAAKAIVLPGRTIGENAIVAAGAVVTGSVPPAKIVAGNPARVIGERGIEASR